MESLSTGKSYSSYHRRHLVMLSDDIPVGRLLPVVRGVHDKIDRIQLVPHFVAFFP